MNFDFGVSDFDTHTHISMILPKNASQKKPTDCAGEKGAGQIWMSLESGNQKFV